MLDQEHSGLLLCQTKDFSFKSDRSPNRSYFHWKTHQKVTIVPTDDAECTHDTGQSLFSSTRDRTLQHLPPMTTRKSSLVPRPGQICSPPHPQPICMAANSCSLQEDGLQAMNSKPLSTSYPKNPMAISSKAMPGSSTLDFGKQTAFRMRCEEINSVPVAQVGRVPEAGGPTCSTLSMSSQSWSSRSAAISSR